MTDQPSGISRILSGFDRFANGVEARPTETIDVAHEVTQEGITVSVPHVNGVVLGEVASVDFWVPLTQLQLAPADDLLNSRYDPKEDPEFAQYKAAVADLGDAIPSLPILPANRDVTLADGSTTAQYLVYDQPYLYYALIDMKRARAKVHLPSTPNPGAILLHAMAREGQLRREPTILEMCRASRRLREYYHYTLEEIAAQQAANREDRTKPSATVIHYQITVAALPEPVQDMLHRKKILWTHARNIAEAFGGDDQTCEHLALLASQGKRMTVDEFDYIIKRLKDHLSTLVQDADGLVHEVRRDQPLKLVAEHEANTERSFDVGSYERLLVAKPTHIRKEAGRFTVVVIPGDTPEKVAIAPTSFAGLIDWLSARRTNTSMREVEAVLLGFREAMRQEAQRQGLVNRQGVLAPQVNASDTGS